ncbi:hypothetical protein BJ508DRAFT_109292 [Ascobolus immersus RN42]|uniref:Uncharacterized protein n=1 Tax=Ascobolus immersus RN42 TaxID=1160509 RepID=A0A3N4HBG1_ASCIM|nr:hypothetical protein BJ508DRAFT_109292 [Ascobolus immersus RN42]
MQLDSLWLFGSHRAFSITRNQYFTLSCWSGGPKLLAGCTRMKQRLMKVESFRRFAMPDGHSRTAPLGACAASEGNQHARLYWWLTFFSKGCRHGMNSAPKRILCNAMIIKILLWLPVVWTFPFIVARAWEFPQRPDIRFGRLIMVILQLVSYELKCDILISVRKFPYCKACLRSNSPMRRWLLNLLKAYRCSRPIAWKEA